MFIQKERFASCSGRKVSLSIDQMSISTLFFVFISSMQQLRRNLYDILNKHIKLTSPKLPIINLEQALKDVPDSSFAPYSQKKSDLMKLIPEGGCWIDLPKELQKEYLGKSYFSGGGKRGVARRMSREEPSLTLLCSPSQKQTERCHPTETRPFTIREYARIQTFPDNFIFSGPLFHQYKQIGNALPVEMARIMGEQICQKDF